MSAACWWPAPSWRSARRCRPLTQNQVIAFVLARRALLRLRRRRHRGRDRVPVRPRLPLLAEAARAVSVVERFDGFVRGVVALRDLVFFASLHRLLPVRERGGARPPQGGLSPDERQAQDQADGPSSTRTGSASAPPPLGIAGRARASPSASTCWRTGCSRAPASTSRSSASTPSPDGTEQVLAGLKDPITLRLFYSRRLGAAVPVLRRLCRPGAGDAGGIRRPLEAASCASKSSTPSPSARSRTAPWPTACRACRSTSPASRSISASPAPTWWMTSAPSPSSSRTASASSNTT